MAFAIAVSTPNWFNSPTWEKIVPFLTGQCALSTRHGFGVHASSAGVEGFSFTGVSRSAFVRSLPEARGLDLPDTFHHGETHRSLVIGYPFPCFHGWLSEGSPDTAGWVRPFIRRHGLHPTLIGSQRYEIPYHIAPVPFALNVLIIALSLFSIGFVVELGRTRLVQARREPGHCTACGYNLHGITSTCPECGTATCL